jgi:glycosyltransferase involved in cell wall biosynthesis
MICILHGYLLEGSGSNLWTRAIVESLCRSGETVHLVAQERHPEQYPFIAESHVYRLDGTREHWSREVTEYPGRCILHRPELGPLLPVYVRDRYEGFQRVVPMVELSDEELEHYLRRNTEVLLQIVPEHGIHALHANHTVLMSVVAQRVREALGTPFAVMPHGSALEYAVKRDPRLHRMAAAAFEAAGRIFVIGDEMRQRVRAVFPELPGLPAKFSELHLGVDTAQFEPVPRERRPASIERLRERVAELPRGRTPDQTRSLLRALPAADSTAALRMAFHSAGEYEGKAPDADLEQKLERVDWARDRILLFVGRLIAAKGIQSVVAALPLLLERAPDLRLLIVGHGPLREPLEAMLWALQHGDRGMVERIVSHGRALEGDPEGEEEAEDLAKVRLFLDQLRQRGELDAYFDAARRQVRPERAIFTGYLTHGELRYLFPCCDAAVFPSVVREAGPLVFLEALASGVFPLGTYLGGMRASIDAVAGALPGDVAGLMKLDAAPERTVAEIVAQVPATLEAAERHREALREVAVERYDWSSVAAKLAAELHSLR